VFAGVVLATVIQLLLNMLGTGIGASTIDPLAGETPSAETLSLWAGLWWIGSSFIALFIGGWMAGHLAGVPRNLDGMIHGLLTWSVATLLLLFVAGTTVGSLVSGAFNLIGGGVAAVAPQAAKAAGDALAEEDVTWNKIVQEAYEVMRASDQEFESLLDRLVRGGKGIVSEVDREAAINLLVERTDMSQAEAARTVDNWIALYQRTVPQTKQQAREVADTTADAVAKGMIWGFLALLFGAAAAGCGGIIGAPRTRVYAEVARSERTVVPQQL